MGSIFETLTQWELETLDTMGIVDKITNVENSKGELLEALKNLVDRNLIKDTEGDHYAEVTEAIRKAGV